MFHPTITGVIIAKVFGSMARGSAHASPCRQPGRTRNERQKRAAEQDA